MSEWSASGELTVIPANKGSWEDVLAVFGHGATTRCMCQRFKVLDRERASSTPSELADQLRDQIGCDASEGPRTSGLLAYLDGEPVGWCAIERRTRFPHLRASTWLGRVEDPDDPKVWAITCFLVRREYRRQGVAYALASAAVDFAQSQGAEAVEGYPLALNLGEEITWDEIGVGPMSVFEEAGFTEVGRSSRRRPVMRVELPR